jgi:predicted transcriptional regulator
VSYSARQRVESRTEQLIDLVQDGATLEEAGSAFGITRERVRQILKREGIDVRALPGRSSAKAQRRLDRVRERGPVIDAMWQQGMSYPQIARALGLSQRALKQVVHERVTYEQRLARAARKHSERSRMLDEWALEAIRDAARILGRTPSCRAYARLRTARLIDGPAPSLITSRLGWSAACELAGLAPNPCARPRFGTRLYSEQDLRAALARVTKTVAHPPSVKEYDAYRRDGEPTAITIRHRYGGSWLRARSQLLSQR